MNGLALPAVMMASRINLVWRLLLSSALPLSLPPVTLSLLFAVQSEAFLFRVFPFACRVLFPVRKHFRPLPLQREFGH